MRTYWIEKKGDKSEHRILIKYFEHDFQRNIQVISTKKKKNHIFGQSFSIEANTRTSNRKEKKNIQKQQQQIRLSHLFWLGKKLEEEVEEKEGKNKSHSEQKAKKENF